MNSEQIFELVYDSNEAPPWRVMSPDGNRLGDGQTVMDAIQDAEEGLYECTEGY